MRVYVVKPEEVGLASDRIEHIFEPLGMHDSSFYCPADFVGLFFTHIFGYQFLPTADLFHRFEKMTYEALV